MANPRVYEFGCSSWYWNACKIHCALKDKDTVILAKTIVEKGMNGKVEVWNLNTSQSTGPLYVVAEDSQKGEENVLCLGYGEVKSDELILPNTVKWDSQDSEGLNIFDNIIMRSHIKLI